MGSYTERVAGGECVMLFLRECSDEAKPFYTVEVREQKAVQVRGMGDCGMTPEVAAFIADWEPKGIKRPASFCGMILPASGK